jgi:hypothetical protein
MKIAVTIVGVLAEIRLLYLSDTSHKVYRLKQRPRWFRAPRLDYPYNRAGWALAYSTFRNMTQYSVGYATDAGSSRLVLQSPFK